MTDSSPFVTKFKWKLERPHISGVDFLEMPSENLSPEFKLDNDASIKFVLFFDGNSPTIGNPNSPNFGLKLKNEQSRPKNLSIKMGLKRNNMNLFDVAKEIKWYGIINTTFKSENDSWEPELNEEDRSTLKHFYQNHTNHNLTLCCEITDLNPVRFKSESNPNTSFRTQLYELYKDGLENELTLQVQDKVFKVSRNIIISQSDVFKAGLTNPNFQETQKNFVHIDDFKPETIQAFIQWLYLGEADNFESVADDLFVVADKYEVKQLKDECAEELANSLNNNNLASRFILAILHSHDPLKNYIIDHISQKPSNDIIRFFMSRDWVNFVKTHDYLVEDIMRQFESRMG